MKELNIDGGIVGKPDLVGVSQSGLENVINLLKKQVKEGLHSGAQLHVARRGETILNVAVGEAQPGIPMKINSAILLYSSSKPWTAIAIAQLWEKKKIRLNQTIKSIIPEFAGGKEKCTIRNVLNHTGGFPMLAYNRKGIDSNEKYIAAICKHEAEYTPGSKLGYHPGSGFMILGEIVHRVDGRPIEKYLDQEIFKPLGMKQTSLGVTEQRIEKMGDLLALKDTPVEIFKSQVPTKVYPNKIFNPSGSGYGSAYDMGIFYKMLWYKGYWNKAQIVKKETMELFTDIQIKGIFDKTMGMYYTRGYGFGLGKHCGTSCSRKAFGHGGAGSCMNYCDPELDLIVNFNSNTRLQAIDHFTRHDVINTAIYDACDYIFN